MWHSSSISPFDVFIANIFVKVLLLIFCIKIKMYGQQCVLYYMWRPSRERSYTCLGPSICTVCHHMQSLSLFDACPILGCQGSLIKSDDACKNISWYLRLCVLNRFEPLSTRKGSYFRLSRARNP